MHLWLNFITWSLVFSLPSFTSSSSPCPSEASTISPCICSQVRISPSQYGKEISCSGLVGLPNLTTILRTKLCGFEIDKFRLQSSDISYLPSNLFYKVKVREIFIAFTNISHFTEAGRSAFFGLERTLSTLSMRNCELVDSLKWEKIGDLEALISLDLSDNKLETIPEQWFLYPPHNLLFLYLKGNRISHIQSRALSTMHKLMSLDLSENQISTLERSMFPYPGNSLTFLSLSYNNLSILPDDIFDEMFGLRRIYLDNNNMEVLQKDVWTSVWTELVILDLNGNRLDCSCSSMMWLSKLYPIEHLYGKCDAPEEMKGRKLKSLLPWHFNCSHNEEGENESSSN